MPALPQDHLPPLQGGDAPSEGPVRESEALRADATRAPVTANEFPRCRVVPRTFSLRHSTRSLAALGIERLAIRDFRLVRGAELDLSPGANLFVGENAQGKTTILEAVSYLARGRSFRTARDKECLASIGAGAAGVASAEARFLRHGSRRLVRAAITPSGKTFWLDGKPLRTVGELWGVLPIVTFLPDDLELVRGVPTVRRSLLDALLAQVDPTGLAAMQSYGAALRQRNALIRDRAPAAQLDAWEAQMAQWAAKLLPRRQRLVVRLAECVAHQVQILSRGTEAVTVTHDTGWPADSEIQKLTVAEAKTSALEEPLAAAWRDARAGDHDRLYTRHGPHRGDLVLRINGRDARVYASQGQARTLALALRLAERELLEQITGEPPVLVLDDVLGELDRQRSEHFIRLLSRDGVQSLLTATDAAPLEAELPIGARFHVAGGTVRRT